MRIGDSIRVLKLPCRLPDEETKSLFELCLGRIFPVVRIIPVPDAASELLELEVGEVVGKPPCIHSIWIEKEFVEIVDG